MEQVVSTPHQTDKAAKQLIMALAVASVVIYINLYLMQGMLPLLAEHFDVALAKTPLVLSVSTASVAIGVLFYALISDWVGRKQPIVVSLILLSLSNLLLFWISSFEQLLWLRVLQGLLIAAIPAVAMAYFKERLTIIQFAYAAAVYIAANSIGGISGRLFGGFLSQYLSWHQAIACFVGVTFVGVVVTLWLLRAQSQIKVDHVGPFNLWRELGGFGYHLKDKPMWMTYLIGGLAFLVMVNQFSYIQLHLMATPFNWSRLEVTFIFLCYLSGTLVSYYSARLINALSIERLFHIAAGLMLLGSCITLFDTLAAIWVGFFVSCSGFFMCHSCCNKWVAERAMVHRAKATSLYLCSYYLGAAIGGALMLPFWHQYQWTGVVAISISMLLLMWLIIGLKQYALKRP
ncbi:MFS transporter [Shewanella marina]|uniref:MFS transporter n=1 Tax=Shewanella marina TaxID=487319 RepID=UPI000B20F3CB|nr:MFS transporter [Shewanella marina]